MKLKKSNGGFTLIELLVVIAIIGILASVVLASLSSARNKGNNAKIEGQLSNMRAAAEIYYSTNNGYVSGTNSVCSPASGDTSGLANLLLTTSYPGGVAPTCNATTSAWAASHQLADPATGAYWCVDSSGQSKQEAAQLTTNPAQTQCP